MKKNLFKACFVMCALAVAGCETIPPMGEPLTVPIEIKNNSSSTIQVNIYSQYRRVVWPSGGTSYQLDRGETLNREFTCLQNEKVCYGGWKLNTSNYIYWGVGYNDEEGCSDCCFTCGGQYHRWSMELSDE